MGLSAGDVMERVRTSIVAAATPLHLAWNTARPAAAAAAAAPKSDPKFTTRSCYDYPVDFGY
jgi:hypothetical protein